MYKLFTVFLFFLFSCQGKSESEAFMDQQYEAFKERLAADSLDFTAVTPAQFIAESHPDEKKRQQAAQWLTRYNQQQEADRTALRSEQATQDRRFDSLGGLTLIQKQTAKKCNLFEAYYVVNKPTRDSAALAFMVKYAADDLFHQSKRDPGCSYPVMAQVFIYARESDYRQEITNYVATCSITPSHPAGEVWVNHYNTKKFITSKR